MGFPSQNGCEFRVPYRPILLLPFHCRFRFIAADLQSEVVAARCSVSFAHPKLFSRCLAAESTTYYSSSLFFSLPWIFSRRRGNCVATRVTLYLRRSSISVIGTNLCYRAIPVCTLLYLSGLRFDSYTSICNLRK
ncbi:unnamed protein product [Lactuca saligna]|uniref:Uncharacterized protein n=1 Tax=Lactuca saligna TaxID=75948 RepID=A0AA36EHZ4_LACSI|nr:unnamed protein product [Lactuca saligna]